MGHLSLKLHFLFVIIIIVIILWYQLNHHHNHHHHNHIWGELGHLSELHFLFVTLRHSSRATSNPSMMRAIMAMEMIMTNVAKVVMVLV